MWGIFLANAYGLGLVAALIAVAAHVILRTPELLLVIYSWLKVEKMDGERPRKIRTDQRPLHRPQWEPDTVYLVQWPVSPHVRSISPFALKVTLPSREYKFTVTLAITVLWLIIWHLFLRRVMSPSSSRRG